MRCGTNFDLFYTALDDGKNMSELDIIRRTSEAGFTRMDLSATKLNDPNFFLRVDDWERRVDLIGETAAKCGITFSQLHLPYHKGGAPDRDPRFKEQGFSEVYERCMERAYLAGGRLGIPWAAAHCIGPWDNGFDREDTIRLNREFYDKYVELGIKHGVGTAFENMVQGAPGRAKIRYTAHQDELIEYVDGYHDPMVQICWDFGHANIVGLDQRHALRKVGKRLKIVHVQDNHGGADEHLIPFMGNVDWYMIADVLAEIGFDGTLSLESGGYPRNAPRGIQDQIAKLAYASCDHLRRLCEEAAQRRATE